MQWMELFYLINSYAHFDQVSILKVLLIAGMHQFPLSCALGTFNGIRKNLTRIIQDGTIPLLRPFILKPDAVGTINLLY